MSNSYKIDLGVSLNQGDLGKIKTQLNNFQNQKKIELEINRQKIDNQLNSIRKQIKNLSNIKIDLGGNGSNSLSLNTEGLDKSLKDIAASIITIKNALGTLDNASSMKSLLSSVNQIATALGKAENESDSLVKSLNALSKKDFSFNVGIDLGNANKSLNPTAYGRKARKQIIPELQSQAKDLEDVIKQSLLKEAEASQNAISNAARQIKYPGGKTRTVKLSAKDLLGLEIVKDADWNTAFKEIGDPSHIKNMEALETHVTKLKALASSKGINLDSFYSQHSKGATELINDVVGLENALDKAGDVPEKLKNLFGGSVDGERLSSQLDDIVANLNEIRDALKNLSEGISISEITQSFKEMSVVLKDITDNLTIFKNAFGNVGSGLNTSVNNATQGLKKSEDILESFKRSLQNIGMEDDQIDEVAKRIQNLGVQIETLNKKKLTIPRGIDENGEKLPDKEILTVDISGIDKLGNAVKLTQDYKIGIDEAGNATVNFVRQIDQVSTVQQKAGKSANTFVKQQKKAVADLTNDINELNRKANDQNASRPIKDSSHLDSLATKYDEITNAIQRMKSASSDTFVDEQNNVKKLISEYKSLVSEYRNAENVSTKMKGTDFASGLEIAKNNLEKFKAKAQDFSQLTQTIQELDKAIEGVGDKSSLDSFTDQLRVANAELDKIKAEASVTSKANKLLGDAFNVKLSGGYSKVVSDLEKLQTTSVEAKTKLDILKTSYKNLESAQQSYSNVMQNSTSNTQQKIEAANRLIAVYKQYQNALEGSNALVKEEVNTEIFANKKAAALEKISDYTNRNTIAAKKYNEEIKIAQQLFANAATDTQHKVAQSYWNTLTKKIKAAGDEGQTAGEKFKKAFASITQYLSAAQLFNYAQQALRSMFEQVKLIDSAMTELKKVTNETDEAYSNFLKNAATRSREIGTTIDGLVSSTADFARLGYGFEDAQGLAEVANIYAVVGDEIEGVEGATESLISTMAAFKDEMNGMSNTDFAMSIIDKFNEIGNNFSISSGGIGEALERSASSLMAANNTIDESIALITAANTVVQDPEQVGTAFKTISMRVRGAKTELEEAGLETDGMVESTAKLRSEILALTGVDIMDGANQFKSTYAIMDELAVKWKDLTDIQQATVTELIAGKRQGNIVSSLMSNFDTAREALETSMNSAGSAMKEHEKWQQSLEAQINKLKAAWQGLSQAFLSSDFLHGALEAVIKLVDGLTKLIDTFGAFPTLMGTVAAGFSLLKNGGLFKTFNNDLDGFSNKIGIANKSFAELMKSFKSANTGGFKGIISGFKSMFTTLKDPLSDFDRSAIAEYNKLVDQGAVNQENLARVMQGTSIAAQNMVSSANGAKVSLSGVKTGGIAAALGLTTAKIAAMAFNAALTMGISIAIQFIMEGLMAIFNASDDTAEKVDELTESYKQQHEEFQKLKRDYDTSNESSMISKYAKLSKGVDGLGRNVSLTTDEYSEYQSIVNKIAEQIPSLVSGYDEQGNALLRVKGDVEQVTEAYENLIHLQNQKVLSGNAGDIEKNWENALKQAKGYDFWETVGNLFAGAATAYDGVNPTVFDMKLDTASWLGGLESGMSIKEIEEGLGELTSFAKLEIIQALQSAGYDISPKSTDAVIARTLGNALKWEPEKIKGILDNYYAQFDDAVSEYKIKATALLSEAFDVSSSISGLNYDNISEELQSIAYQTINSLDFFALDEISKSGKTIDQWTKELLNELNTIGKTQGDYIADAFELQTQFNGGDIDYGDYISKLKEVESVIDGLDLKDEAKQQLKISLGLDENGVVEQYDALIKRLTTGAENSLGLDAAAVKKFVDDLSAEEYAVFAKIVPNLDKGTTLDEIQSLIDEQLAEEFKFDIKVQTEGIEALNTALAESRSAAGMTAESIEFLKARYEDLDGFNAAALFEKTANGIRLNSDELSRLEEQYVNTNKLEIDKNLNTLIEKYQDVTEEIKTCTDAQKKEELQASADYYKDKIDELSTLASQYDGLTSAFTKWQNALNGAEEGDNYDSVFENLEAMKELDDKKLYGTDKYKTFAQLMSYEDLSSASIDKIGKAFDKGYKKAERYFTESKKGSTNFLNDLNKINSEWAHINKNGDWEVNINAEEAAKKLGISVEAVLLLLDKLKDYGVEVNIEDTSVDNLQTKIQQTEAKLKELGQSPVDINVDIEASSSNLGKIESEIEKAKSKIAEINNSSVSPEVKTAQLEDARAKLEALIQKKQEASQPAFMNLNTSQVNASLVDALDKIKEYQNALNELNKLQELKEAGIAIDGSEIDAAQKKIDDCAKAIQGLDGDVKVAIGLEEDGSIDSIKKAFEEGKVKIDANTDPAVNKIEQLAENVERIEDKDITINVTVNGLDQVKELNKQINLATDIQGDINKLSEYVESAKALDELGENITSYVTAEIKGNVIDEFEYKLNNLKVFTDSAKDIEEIGYVQSEVTANIKGNVVDEFEYKIDNLKVYSDSAKNVSDIGDVESTVKANIKGNVIDEFEYKINNLKAFSESAKDIYKIGNVESNVKATINSGEDGDVIDEFEYKLDNLKKFAEYAKELQNISDVDISVKATVNTGGSDDVVEEFEYKLNNLSEFANHVKELQGLKSIDISVNAVVNTGKDGDVVDEFEYKLNNLAKFADHVKELQGLESVNVSVNANVNTGDGSAVDEFEYKLNNLETFAEGAKALQGIGNVSSEITAKVNTGESGDAVDTFEYKLNNLKTFAEGAKALQGVGNVSSAVTAEINSGSNGDVIDEFEYKLNNLEKFAQYAKDLQGVGSVNVSVSAKVNTGEDGDVTDTFEYKLNNLDEFATYAKELQGLEDVNITIKANIKTGEDSATNEWEYRLNNLDNFASYAKDLQGLESVDITISANAKGNVVGEKTEGKINNLEVFAKGAKGLDGLESKEITITANAKGNVVGKKTESKINNLEVFAVGAKKVQGLSSKDITITANAKGNVVGKKTESKINNLEVFAKGAKSLQGISSKEVTITANADGNVVGDKTEGKINNLKVFGDSAKALNGVESKKVSITADANGNVVSGDGASGRLFSLTEFKSLISGMSNQTVTVSVTANVDSANITQAITLLTNVANSGVFKNYTATVQVGAKIATVDDTAVKNYQAPPKEGKVSYSVNPESSVYTWTAPSKNGVVNYSASVEALTDAQKHKTGTITYKANIIGFGGVANGTANANGSAFVNGTSGKAFKQGDWGVKKTTTALTGELGQELVVYKNRWYTVGDNGAEFATIPKGAIVFNHKQTEELFKNGKVTSDGGRGRALANGTAFASGTDSEAFDWFEIYITRLERVIDKLDKTVNDAYKSWSSRNTALTEEIENVAQEIRDQQSGAKLYEKQLANVELNKSAKNMGYGDLESAVRDGSINIKDYEESIQQKINEYKELYEKQIACEDAAEELSRTLAELNAQKFDNIMSEYDGILQGFEHTESMLEEYISQAEEKGHLVSKNYYQALKDNKDDELTQLRAEQSDLIAERDRLVNEGHIDKYSKDWYDMCSEIDGVTQAIEEGTTALIEYDNALRDIDWQVFDLIQERISDITEEANFLIDLMSYDKLFDDNGKLTDKGMATMGLHGQNYNTYMYQADDYGAKVKEIDDKIASGEYDPYDDKVIAQRQEYIELQREAILNAEDEKQAIKDLVEEGISLELDALQERIDLHNEELDSMKDLYDYQKNVQEQTENIASLQKQLHAYEGFDDEETRATIQKLKVELAEANADLEETQYDKYIADQAALLDELFLEYENVLNTRLDNTDALITQVIDAVNIAAGAEGTIATALGTEGAIAKELVANGVTIKSTLENEAKSVGTTLSAAMKGIWSVDEGNAKSVLELYGKGFQDKQTTTNSVLGDIKAYIGRMVDDVDKDATTKVKSNRTSTSAKKAPTKTSTATTTKITTANKSSGGNGKPEVGDKVKFISGKYYYDSEGKKPLGSKNHGKYVYITNVNNKKWATHPIHISTGKKLGSGDLGWLKKSQISGYATGKKNFLDNEIAWTQENGKEFIVRPSDGAILTPIAKGDSVLNAQASGNIWNMANNPAEFIKDSLKLDATNVPNGSSVNNSCVQNFENITFSMPNVRNYEQLVSEMQRDPKFEKFILAMTLDQVAGKSKLGKNKAIR